MSGDNLYPSDGDTDNIELSSQIENKVQQLISDGRKIQAIKWVRELTGVGLKEAKGYVEQFQHSKGGETGVQYPYDKNFDRIVLPDYIVEEIRRWVRSGRIIDAVRRVRELTGAGL
jgi:ribosomal protein L7/L12